LSAYCFGKFSFGIPAEVPPSSATYTTQIQIAAALGPLKPAICLTFLSDEKE
jgi:hypothetical protein